MKLIMWHGQVVGSLAKLQVRACRNRSRNAISLSKANHFHPSLPFPSHPSDHCGLADLFTKVGIARSESFRVISFKVLESCSWRQQLAIVGPVRVEFVAATATVALPHYPTDF